MTRPGDHPSAAWAGLAPGTVLNAVLETFEPPALSRRELPRVAAAYQRQGAHLDAMQARVIAELAGRVDPPGGPATAVTIAEALHLELDAATDLVSLAVDLVSGLPATLAALDDGRITLAKARLIAQRTRRLGPATRAAVEAVALARAPQLTEAQLRRWLDDAMAPGNGEGRATS
ncbi:DUF222 domain-containing protein [Jiangella alba]|uniref:DUF222 domain-containing protein n=1 Tax=Jiangella alba TaxID=561176 RepID=A0A1H5PW48_9ACTN|nr:DUF222 domain-containing protein [Jiangella alba]SEF17874.1 protein of unknown function [Jiangella alba]